jgi:general secretion pathway protein M
MQVIPDQRNSKMTALLLLAIALILVYLLVFHWFVLRHGEYAEEIGDLRTQLNRFQTVASQREELQLRLGQVRNSQNDAGLFLEYPSFDEAAAAMSGDIGDLVRTQADESCQIVSRQPVRPRVQERFQKVTVNVRMRCDAEDFLDILYGMETGMPLMLVDDLNVIRPRTRRRTQGQETAAQGALDIRFNVSGYLK